MVRLRNNGQILLLGVSVVLFSDQPSLTLAREAGFHDTRGPCVARGKSSIAAEFSVNIAPPREGRVAVNTANRVDPCAVRGYGYFRYA